MWGIGGWGRVEIWVAYYRVWLSGFGWRVWGGEGCGVGWEHVVAKTGLSDIAVEFCMFLAVFHFWPRDLLYS